MAEVTTPSGLKYDDLTIGTGAEAKAGQTVSCTTPAGSRTGRSSIPAWTGSSRSSFRSAWGGSSKAGTKACRA
jgi:hypothetical protein